MSKRRYAHWKCWVCQKCVSAAGAARVNHMRMHVREGVVEEIDRLDRDGRHIVYQYRPIESKEGE